MKNKQILLMIVLTCTAFAGQAQELASLTSKLEGQQTTAPDSNHAKPPTSANELAGKSTETSADTMGNGKATAPATQNYTGILTRVNREYQQALLSSSQYQERANSSQSGFGFRYTPESNQAWLEYRFSERGALRMRGASRGVKIVAAWKF